MLSCSHKSRYMGDIAHEVCPGLVCDLPESLKIYGPGICRCACKDKLRLMLHCKLFYNVVVYKSVIVHAVRDYIEKYSGEIDRASMRKMSAVIQTHAEDGVPRLKHCDKYRHVCLCP